MHRAIRYFSKPTWQPLTNHVKHKQVDPNLGERQLSVLYGRKLLIPVDYATSLSRHSGFSGYGKEKGNFLKEKGT